MTENLFKGDEKGLVGYVDITAVEKKYEQTWSDLICRCIDAALLAPSEAEQFLLDVIEEYKKAQQALTRQDIASSLPGMSEEEILNVDTPCGSDKDCPFGIADEPAYLDKDGVKCQICEDEAIVQAYKDEIKKWLEGE